MEICIHNGDRRDTDEGIALNCVGLTDSEYVYNEDGKILEVSCTSKVFGQLSSVSASVQDLIESVNVLCILRNPVLTCGHVPCKITTTLLGSVGTVPAGFAFTFSVGRDPRHTGSVFYVNREEWKDSLQQFGFSMIIKCERNVGEIVWNICIPKSPKSGTVDKPRGRTSGDSKLTRNVNGVCVKSPRAMQLDVQNLDN